MSVRIIGIGASAGGLQALESFFSEIPSGLGVAFVVVQHLSMDHASSISAILQRTTSLRVESLNKLTVPEPNTVYVKMPEVDVEVDSLTIRTTPRQAEPGALYLPIDDFFFSLAKSRAEEAVAIVLSGMGTDGSRGLKEIKSRGGLVMVQHPDSAQFDGMPQAALRQHLADVVLPPAELASRLTTILRSSSILDDDGAELEELTQSELVRALLDRIQKSSRIDFNRYRPATIMRRIEKRMLIRQFSDLFKYVNFAIDDEEELLTLRQSFLIGVTRFFRDQDAFDLLAKEVVPSLFEQSEDREIRIWVPACSTGEEAYSIAMLVQDYIDQHRPDRRFKIFGSDVDRKSIIFAANGVYDDSIAGDVPPLWLQRYFTREPPGYRVRPELKENILFAVQNLLNDPPFIRIDFLSCRNFLIYIIAEAQQRILANFHFSLNPSGCLMLGPSESLGGLQSAFNTIDRRWKVYRKRHGGKTSTGKFVAPHIKHLGQRNGIGISIVSSPRNGTGNRPSPLPEQEQNYTVSLANMDYYARYLSERYAPATLFVNKQYEILYLNGDFSGMLHLPRFNAALTLHTMVNEDAESLLTAGVDRVLRTGASGIYEKVNIAGNKDEPRYYRVRFSVNELVQLDEPVAMLEFFRVEEADSSEESESDEVYSVDRRLKDKIRKLEAELLSSEQRGQKLYNELEATNEELQSSNRELLASNEEMQSTNEELQSVNEELYTVNNEFQRKNEELNHINNDVNNLLKSTQISTIFVDNQLRIRRFTPGVGPLFDLHSSDLGRPIMSFSNPFEDLNLEEVCRRVLTTNVRHDQEIQDRKGNFYLLRLLPYLTEMEEVEGIVITFVDINDLVRTRRRLTDMANKYRAIFENTEETIVVMRENSRIEEVNQALTGLNREQLLGQYFTDLIDTDQEKVRFNECLRTSFDNHEVASLELSLKSQSDGIIYTKLEIIPIAESEEGKDEVNRVKQVMAIVHDITTLQEEREESSAMITKYADALFALQQDAGLLDLEDRMISVNHMRGHMHERGHYVDKNLSDFVTKEGMAKYREAVRRLKGGSLVEKVTFELEDLTDDNQARTVLYRPVYLDGKLAFISFETVILNGDA